MITHPSFPINASSPPIHPIDVHYQSIISTYLVTNPLLPAFSPFRKHVMDDLFEYLEDDLLHYDNHPTLVYCR